MAPLFPCVWPEGVGVGGVGGSPYYSGLSLVQIFISICFKLIIKHNHTQKQRKIEFEPRLKLNHSIYNLGSFAVLCQFSLISVGISRVRELTVGI